MTQNNETNYFEILMTSIKLYQTKKIVNNNCYRSVQCTLHMVQCTYTWFTISSTSPNMGLWSTITLWTVRPTPS